MVFKNKNLFSYFVLLAILLLISVVYIVSEDIKSEKIEIVKQEKYNIYSKNLHNDIDILIKNKQELTFSLALSLAQDSSVKNAILNKNIVDIKLKEFSKYLSKTTQLQNTWFHIIDSQGTSIYRSWVPKRGDSILNIRIDVVQMIKKPQIMSTISTGKFDMTFKSMVPIYHKGVFIGMFEVITHFNSIAQQLHQKGIGAVMVVDKKYKKQIKKPFSKTFVDDYYIANYNAKGKLLNYLKEKKVENYIHSTKKYILDKKNNHFIVVYNIPDIKGEPMGSIVAFKELNSLNMEDIKAIKDNVVKYTAVISLSLLLLGYFLISLKHSRELDRKVQKRTIELEKEKNYIKTILDTNPNIIIVTNSFKVTDANKRFLEFFQYDSLEEFIKEHDCICDFFTTLDEEVFCKDKMVQGIPWAKYIANNKQEHVVQLKFNEQIYIFTVNAEYLQSNGDILLTFQNITEIKKKDRLLYEQSKLASMGEMIGNIAHQWRQPLGVVSSGATGMKLQKELNLLSDEQFYKTCDHINENAQYLSKTIDDFRNFIKGDREESKFNLKEELDKVFNLIFPSIKSNNIQLHIDIDEQLEIVGFSNELTQCFINIYSNSKDALKQVPQNSRVILVDAYRDKEQVVITFKDSGGGIPSDIIGKVFEPYFTTKHQKQGTGLGLHMTYNMIVHGMSGEIEAYNEKFMLYKEDYYGAVIKITLPS